jgi:large subunit ribosomal protein L24
MHRIKKEDSVIVITGKDKDKSGRVLRVVDDEHVVIEGINVVKRHTKPNPVRNIAGGIVEREMPIHISNIALLNPSTNKADKVGFKFLTDGKKVRYFKSNGEVLDS